MTKNSELYNKLTSKQVTQTNLLFHYTSLVKGLSIASGNSLRFSSITNMNDPLEYIDPSSKFNGVEITDLDRVAYEIELAQKKRRATLHTISLTQEIDWNTPEENVRYQNKRDNLFDKGWARTRMWAQYADKGKGVCLVFDKEKLLKCAESQYNGVIKTGSVNYTNDFYKIKNDFEIELTSEKRDFSNYYLQDDKINYLFTKNEDFRDEQEFRILLNKENNTKEPFEISLEDSLLGIIFGIGIDKKVCANIGKLLPIEKFKIDWEYGTPNLY